MRNCLEVRSGWLLIGVVLTLASCGKPAEGPELSHQLLIDLTLPDVRSSDSEKFLDWIESVVAISNGQSLSVVFSGENDRVEIQLAAFEEERMPNLDDLVIRVDPDHYHVNDDLMTEADVAEKLAQYKEGADIVGTRPSVVIQAEPGTSLGRLVDFFRTSIEAGIDTCYVGPVEPIIE